jgi:RHS repeat-associated protein
VVTDDDLAPVTTLMDGQGRVVHTERIIDGTVEAGEASYDAADHLVSLCLQPAGSSCAATHSFEYDGLGRLTFASDPDIGDRFLVHNDDGFLIEATNAAGQSIEYGYDDAGRVTSVVADDGSSFTYHYDTPQDSSYQYTAGRLAWVEEGTGTVQVGYDARGRQTRFQRTIDDTAASATLSAEETHVFSPSGLLRSVDFQDGLAIDLAYDDAGRPSQVGDLWTVGQYDPAGRILAESFGNGVTQAYSFDESGDLASVEVRRPPAAGAGLLYQASVTRNGVSAITSVTDSDGTGLDHNASFTYDPAGRLTDATLGPVSAQYQFHYSYDGLQNMVERGASGPTALGALTGEYHYGGARAPAHGGGTHGPRQLTSVQPLGGGTPTATFQYDLAGRLVEQGNLALTYNGLDQLTQISGLAAGSGTVTHAYGYDGFRVLTRSTAGATQYWFTPGISERNGLREHYIRLGDRLIARVDQRELQPLGGGGVITVGADPRPARALLLALLALSLVLLGRAFTGARSRPRARAAAIASLALAAGLAQSGCFLFGSGDRPLWENAGTLYFHHGISPGPTLLTREDGTVLEERRYEPFGDDIDALREPAGGGTPSTGAIDFTVDAHNILNKQSDPDTGWSYHGARWMAPETARWLTPDPPVKAPDPRLAAEPWSAHPYQYVNQNPIAFWDPDGRDDCGVFGLPGNGCGVIKNEWEHVDDLPAKAATAAAEGVGTHAVALVRGFGRGAVNTASAFYHWQDTVRGLAHAATHPLDSLESLYGRGDPFDFDTEDVGELLGGAAVGGALSKLGTLGKLGRTGGLRQLSASRVSSIWGGASWKIAGTRGLEHSFGRHAAQWFGREVPVSTHLAQWQRLVEQAAASGTTVDWALQGQATVGHLARIEGKFFFAQFFKAGPRAGELATAFVPNQAQLRAIRKAAK